MKKWIAWCFVITLVCLGCASLHERGLRKQLEQGRPFEPDRAATIATTFHKRWMGDSAKLMDPYVVIEEGAAALSDRFGLGLDETALSEIDFAVKGFAAVDPTSFIGYMRVAPWQGKPLFAPGGAQRAVAQVPIWPELRMTDSIYIPLQDDPHDDQDGRIQTFTKFEHGKRSGLLLTFDQLCQADLLVPTHHFLFYNAQGLLASIVDVSAPCAEGRCISYIRYTWDDQFYLRQIRQWAVSESQSAEETNVAITQYDW